ncbi:flagellar hook-length control protein FliK [Lysobacter sp. 2RAF19]
MIGGAMGAPAAAPTPAPTQTPANANADASAAQAPDTQGAAATTKPKSPQSPANDGADADAPPDFDSLLAAHDPAEATATPADPARAPATRADNALDAATAPMPPDQLLALLVGSQAISATPANTPAQATATPPGDEAMRAARPASIALPIAGTALPAAAATKSTDATATTTSLPTHAAVTAFIDAANGDAPNATPQPASDFSNLLAAPAPVAASHPTNAAAAVAPTAPPLSMPADPDAGFDDAFGAQIGWMAGQRIGHAQIRISPDNLGPIDVRVEVDGTRVNAQFHSAHAEVRHALEASVPRLREMLGQQGLQLEHADVGQRRQNDARPMAHGATPDAAAPHDGATTAATLSRPLRTRGLVDEYA